MELVCLTHGRARTMTTHRVFGDELVLSVAESQVAEYREAHPDLKIDPHPDDVVGLPAKKNYVVAKFGEVFMLDDDVLAMVDHVEGDRVDDPRRACDLVRRLADMARQMGAVMFGFSGDANPLHYLPHRPFALTGLIDGGKFGVLDSSIWWPEQPIYGCCEDMWACGLNAYENRYLLKDLRYALVGPTENNDLPGGLAGVRNQKALQQCAEMLVEAFGEAVQLKPQSEAGKYFWRLRVPW